AARALAVMDARMHEVYWGCFSRDREGLAHALGQERVGAPERIRLPQSWAEAGGPHTPGWGAGGGVGAYPGAGGGLGPGGGGLPGAEGRTGLRGGNHPRKPLAAGAGSRPAGGGGGAGGSGFAAGTGASGVSAR